MLVALTFHFQVFFTMSFREGLTVGENTEVSSLQDQVRRYKTRPLPSPPGSKSNKYKAYKSSKYPNPAHESLAMKCVRQLVECFEDLPAGETVPTKFIKEISSRLPLDLKASVAGK